MKITKDSTGSVVLNNGAHRVTLSADLVEAIVAQVYAESPRAESEGRMVVVELLSRKVAIRPGKEPTVANEDLNWRCWRYTTPDGQLLEGEAFIRSDWKGETWSGIVGLQSFPDEYSPRWPTREHIQERIEAVLTAEGYEIRDADFSVEESLRERRGQCAPCPVCEARRSAEPVVYPGIDALTTMPICPSCLVPAVLESVQDGGPECALSCPRCGAGWQEDLSDEVIEALLSTKQEPTTGYGFSRWRSAPL